MIARGGQYTLPKALFIGIHSLSQKSSCWDLNFPLLFFSMANFDNISITIDC